jgi:carbamoyl-phosphate synthase large subunit
MEHIEQAGVHSGDSACALPPVTISAEHLEVIEDYTRRIAIRLGAVGLVNIQYAICRGKVYVLEANPRASRTVPLVSKVCDVSMARLAVRLAMGEKIRGLGLLRRSLPHVGVKEAVLPFAMFPEVDPVLGPEMRSTGEVLGMADTFGLAYYKAEEAAGARLPSEGTVLLSVPDAEKPKALEAARGFAGLGFRIRATRGTHEFLARGGVASDLILKMHEGRPHIADAIMNREIQLVVNCPVGRRGVHDDSYIRKAAIRHKVPYITTMAGALAAVQGIAASRGGRDEVKSLQERHAEIARRRGR